MRTQSQTSFHAQPHPLWAQTPLFRGLGEADLAAVAACLRPRPVAAGEVLIRQGVWSGELFIIRAGIVEIRLEPAQDGGRQPVRLRRLVGGDCFGEMSLLTGTLPSATGYALTDGEVWTLSRQEFRRLALAHPELSRNVSAILSERLLQTSRQHLNAEPEQVLVLVGATAGLAHGLARALARLSGRSTLLVDFLGDGAGAPSGAATFGLGDLLGGRLRAGAATPGAGLSASVAASDAGPSAGAAGALTVVRGDAGADGAPAPDLPAALGHLGDCYHYALVALPDGHPALTAHLLHYATRILVAGPVTALPALRARLAALPLPDGARANLRLLLTEAPAAVRPTVATLELFEEELGAPVRAIVPADGERAPEAIAALARWLAGQRVGLALGAGGAKGYAHLGALRALRGAGVPFDCVTGVSIGAIVGAAVATGATAGWIEAAFEAGASRVVRPTLPIFGMLSNRALRDWLRGDEMYGRRLLEDLPIPFAVSAADLTEGREIVVRRGPIWRAVLASAAIPGMYPPVRLGRHWLVDGGVVNPVPVSTAQALGADVVIAVDLSEPLAARQEPGPGRPATLRPPWLATNMLRARDIMMSEIRAHTLGEPSVVVKPQVEGVKLHNFEQGKRFVEAGQAAAEAVLPRLRKQLPWLN